MLKKILLSILAIFLGGILVTAPVLATDKCPKNCVPTSVFWNKELSDGGKCYCDYSGEGTGVVKVVQEVTTVLSVGVGILGVIGITVVGIQYLTAGGNEEKTRKAKRRLFEIVIGLVLYVLIYFLVNWLTMQG